jgi:phenylalanyl-tRNA synthetase alpha chain
MEECMMLDKLEEIKTEAMSALDKVHDQVSLQQWKVNHLGRSSPLMEVFKSMGKMSKEERPLIGKQANQIKVGMEKILEQKQETIRQAALQTSLRSEHLDVTLPGRDLPVGRLHPITHTMRKILNIFSEMGFQVYRSREVETDEFNFEYLNMPAHHPARDMWDTFHTTAPGIVLRTHTSPGQIHAMREYAPEPVRVVLPGMCYRYEQVTNRAEMQFSQVEGLALGRNITFGDLKGTLSDFARRFFNPDVRIRFRAAHFPFTEPSAEMDIECFVCDGVGCSVCKHTGWLEILGSGMVHPTVMRYGGYDPETFSGFAFGMGIERVTMLSHRISDIRTFWRNDLRFLEQF